MSEQPKTDRFGIELANTPLRDDPERRAQREALRQTHRLKGLVIVNTGKGKGKTTAALGILLRAWGRNMRVGGVQFFKHEQSSYGELKALEKMGITLTPMGERWDCVVRIAHSVVRMTNDRAESFAPFRS